MNSETKQFRKLLAKHGMSDPSPYEWIDGEAWYRGHPITANVSTNEGKAIDAMNNTRRLQNGATYWND